tara:strand:- start:4653 stop:5201 length:549 start_codon:yes stop_codon:yes gene_type:complete
MNKYLLIVALTLAGCHTKRPIVQDIKQPESTANASIGESRELFDAKVIGVIDGDTVDVLRGQETIRIRLNGIDAPERGQPFGNNAKQFVSDQIFGKTIQVEALDEDRYGRTIADLHFYQKRITLELVEVGLAWHYTQYSDEEALANAQVEAQQAKRGLWADPRHVAPWDWRKLSKVERDRLR